MFRNADSVFIKNSDQQIQRFIFQKENCYRKYLPISCQFKNLQKNKQYKIQYSFNNIDYFTLIEAKTSNDTTSDLSFLAGSCAFVPTGFNGAIKPFTSLDIFNYMSKDSANFMLWLGDNLYYIFDYHRYKGQLKRNIKVRLKMPISNFMQTKQHYAIWDDHDYGSDNSDGSFRSKKSSLKVFQQFWSNPKNDSFNYYTFQQQDCQFFMLDDRYFNSNDKIVLGKTQLDWLKNELLKSSATFKFIGIGMQALNPISTLECFYKTDNEYKELIAFLKEHKISGVMFISGDRHHGELMRIDEKGLYPLYDFTTSPLTMYPIKIGKKSSEYINPNKVDGTYFPNYNYGKVIISGVKDKRLCTIQLKDKKGKIVWQKEISANELQVK
jgi:alkaline phosphatase D